MSDKLKIYRLGLTLCLAYALMFAASSAQAQQSAAPKISAAEKAANFGIMFVAQSAVYYVTQKSIIEEHGSLDNWTRNAFKPHFDKDSFDFNLIKHSFSGQYYYLFYRSRGYTERSAFIWTFASSLMFEFGIETFTEQPSYQDIYQTPVFGTILGMGMERLSAYFHSVDTIPTTLLGYVLNPMTLLPGAKCNCSVVPTVGKAGEAGFIATLSF